MKKSKSKILLTSVKLLTNFDNPFSNPLQRLKDSENAYRKPHVTLKIIPRKPAMICTLEKIDQ